MMLNDANNATFSVPHFYIHMEFSIFVMALFSLICDAVNSRLTA